MDWKSIAGPLARAGATTLGTIIGGPLGNAVGGVVGRAAAEVLGVEPTPEAVADQIARDPDDAAARLNELETARADEWAALQAEGLKLMQQLAAQESSEGWLSWGWRPALSWLIAAIILQTFIIAPWMQALFTVNVAVPYDNVIGISAIWLTIYGGGHTAKAIFGKGLGS
ncbi:3TM-type holin [Kaistia sp. MMO-174]|uniref:3TM-type holin n=1 Tax=Kaistia sp. MMO-174 TaxID=3081256 RepID=UPI0030182422